jgi:surface antigen
MGGGLGGTGINKADIGSIAGGLGGAFAGSNLGKGSGRTLGIAAGTLLGAMIGNQIGQSLDRADVMYHQQTSQRALETGKTGQIASWRNPDSGAAGTITPTRTFQANGGAYCREFTQTINVGGRSEQAVGTACRQADGTWQLQSQAM